MEQLLKIIVSGLDNAGKTSILTALDNKYDFEKDIIQLKPTIRVEYHKMNFLKNNTIFWDMGGQETYRDIYKQYEDVYFDATDLLIYVMDIQDSERFQKSFEYLDAILQFFIQNEMIIPIIITFHKFDPDLRHDEKILGNIEKLRKEILDKFPMFNILFQQTSIYDIISIVQLVSYGLSVFDKKFFELSELLEKYLNIFKSQALIVFDRNGIIISEYYSDIDPEVYVELLESIKEHLFLLKRMEEENYSSDYSISTVEEKLLSHLHRVNLEKESFFVSIVIKETQKEGLMENLPDFLEDIKVLLEKLMLP